jgi:hypothetical protein
MIGANLCLSSGVNVTGQLIPPISVTVNVPSTVTLCGIVSAFTAATATVPGSITIGGTTLTIAPGTTLIGVVIGSNYCLNASLNPTGQVITPVTVTVNPGITPMICGTVTAYTAATATASGSITIGGVTYIIAPGSVLGGASLILIGANVCLLPVFNGPGQLGPGSTVDSPTQGGPAACPQLAVPAITQGFNVNQDVFALPQPLFLTMTSAPDATVNFFNVTPATFGGTVIGVGGLPTLNPLGVSFSTPNGNLDLLSCLDSFVNVAFVIASTGNTVGDKVNLFLTSAGGAAVSVATFTIEGGGARLTLINPGTSLFLNNRQANGTALSVGAFITFGSAAGTAGLRTDLLLLKVTRDPGAPFNGCFQLGANIKRGVGAGTTSLVFTDVQLVRSELTGDRARVGTGLYFGTIGGYPTGLVCGTSCPSCPVISNPVQNCNTICFRSPGFFLLRTNRLPNGSVVVPGSNFNNPLNIQRNLDLIKDVLQGNGLFGGAMTPSQRFGQQYVTAQINLINGSAGGSVAGSVFSTNLSCYRLTFAPVTLSNGVILSPNSTLNDLFTQATFMTRNSARTNADLNALSDIFALLNGNSLVGCNVSR